MDECREANRALEAPQGGVCLRRSLDTLLEGCQFISFDWKYLYVNPAAARHGRRNAEELVGKSMFECYPGIERTKAFEALNLCMQTRQAMRIETEFEFADGEVRNFELSIRPIAEGICVLSNDITERKELERELLRVSDYEQARIGQDLHDGLCQRLVGIEFRQLALAQRLQEIDARAAAEAAEIGAMVREAVAETRSVARGLSPVIDGPDALGDALSELAESTGRSWGKSCGFAMNANGIQLPHLVSTHLFRIAQEAVNNAVRHSGANKIEIGLTVADGWVTLSVKDDGAGGFPAGQERPAGMGLRTMRYRGEQIGACVVARTRDEGGAEVLCVLRQAPHGAEANAGASGTTGAVNYEL